MPDGSCWLQPRPHSFNLLSAPWKYIFSDTWRPCLLLQPLSCSRSQPLCEPYNFLRIHEAPNISAVQSRPFFNFTHHSMSINRTQILYFIFNGKLPNLPVVLRLDISFIHSFAINTEAYVLVAFS